MYSLVLSRQYIRALKRVSRHKDFDRAKLNTVVNTLLSGKPLDLRHRDHQLSGPRANHRECHIQFDILLEYFELQNSSTSPFNTQLRAFIEKSRGPVTRPPEV